MLRGRDFQHAVNKTIEYGGKAMTAYNIGKAAYTAGRFILPLLLYRQTKMLHRNTVQHVRHHVSRAVRTASNVTAALTPGYQKFVHPVLDALPETRPYARAINNAMAINSAARNFGSAYENIRSAIK